MLMSLMKGTAILAKQLRCNEPYRKAMLSLNGSSPIAARRNPTVFIRKESMKIHLTVIFQQLHHELSQC